MGCIAVDSYLPVDYINMRQEVASHVLNIETFATTYVFYNHTEPRMKITRVELNALFCRKRDREEMGRRFGPLHTRSDGLATHPCMSTVSGLPLANSGCDESIYGTSWTTGACRAFAT